MSVDLGDVVPLSVRVYDSAGDLADATSVALTVTLPDGTEDAVGVIASSSTGVYEYDYQTVEVGRHVARWVATGVNASSFVDVFNVAPADPGFLIGLEELREHLQLSDDDLATEGDELRRFLASASQTVEQLIGPVNRRTVVETHRWAKPGLPLLLRTRPVLSVTSITDVDGNAFDESDYTLDGSEIHLSAYSTGTGWTFWGYRSFWTSDVTVTYVAGRTTVPGPVQEAVAELVRDRRSGSQTGGGAGQFGQDITDPEFTPGRPAVPPYVLSLLEPYLLNTGVP